MLATIFICKFCKIDFKKIVLKRENYLKIYHSLVGKEEIEEVNDIIIEKEKYQNGYLLKQDMNVSLSDGIVIYRGIMDGKKTVLVMSDSNTYKYQNIKEYKCVMYQSVMFGDVLGINEGRPYYEVIYED